MERINAHNPPSPPHVTWRFAIPFGGVHIASIFLLHIPLAETGGDKVILKLFLWVSETLKRICFYYYPFMILGPTPAPLGATCAAKREENSPHSIPSSLAAAVRITTRDQTSHPFAKGRYNTPVPLLFSLFVILFT